MPERVILCIGTKKGLFVAEAAKTRRRFSLRGPFGPGVTVYSSLIDTRGRPRIFASSCDPFFDMKILRSTDLGKTFKETKAAPGAFGTCGCHAASCRGVVSAKLTSCSVRPAL